MKKDCSFIYAIWLRKNSQPGYCLEVTCTVHKTVWHSFAKTIEMAEKLSDVFPLVTGGIPQGPEGFAPHHDCIIGKIPALKK